MVKRSNLSNEVYDYIRKEIVEGRYLPGTRLSDTGLAQQLGVSSTPIREAFQLLAKDRAVELLPKRGCFVKSFDKQQVLEIFEIRRELEALAIRKVIENKAGDRFKELLAGLKAIRNAVLAGDAINRFIDIDRQMHALIPAAGGNAMLEQMLNDQHTWIRTFFNISPHINEFFAVSIDHVLTLLEGLVSHDVKMALKGSKIHFDHTVKNIMTSSKLIQEAL